MIDRRGSRGSTDALPRTDGAAASPAEGEALPELFAEAVRSLARVEPRPEITLQPVRAPQRLAPWTYALSASVSTEEQEIATGRLVVLHDPAGNEAWEGTLRLVSYICSELDPEMALDPMLPSVGWSWLLEALADSGAAHLAAGGTVTRTSSRRFGDLAGPGDSHDLELRASWTPLDSDLAPHLDAWCTLLASTAGLPPAGVSSLETLRRR